jgi:cobalamin synthase
MNAIKTFRDLLSFLTILIVVGGKENFVLTSAEHVYLFPLIGGFIGLLGAFYFLASS